MSTPIKPTGDDHVTAPPADTATGYEPVNNADERSGQDTADQQPWQDVSNPPPVTDPPRAMPRVVPVAPDRATVVARQQERFGGIKAGSAFFGWLTATGMAVILLALLTAAGVAFGVATDTSVDQAVQESENGTGTAQTVGLVGAIALLVVLLASYYCGGYVAGRMARFNGIKQGLAVWLWGVLMTLVIAAIAAVAGAQYDVFAQLNLPRLPVNEGDVTAVGAIAIGAAILASLIGALLGGLAGMRFHRKVDAAGLVPLEREVPATAVDGDLS
jgi:hypothetical protein